MSTIKVKNIISVARSSRRQLDKAIHEHTRGNLFTQKILGQVNEMADLKGYCDEETFPSKYSRLTAVLLRSWQLANLLVCPYIG